MSRQALHHLKKVDSVMAKVIAAVGACRFSPRTEGTHFDAVVRSIVYQQLSGKAAATIHGRLVALYGKPPLPQQILKTPVEKLRAVGLSGQKSSYLYDLAQKVHEREVPIDKLDSLDDDAVIEALVSVKGVGRWTAQMFLMFRLGRLDVLPDADLGIQKGIQRAYGLRKLPTPEKVRSIGAPWKPYSSIASWYLWRSLDGEAAL
jgi:DNA-3-methyladenine glycosylase II